MAKTYVSNGETMEFTAGSNITSGSIVAVGAQIGVALVDIASGETGTLALSGVFTLPKVTTAEIGKGEEVIFDSSAGAFEDSQATPATGDISKCCIAMEAAGNGATEVDVKINVGVGVVA